MQKNLPTLRIARLSRPGANAVGIGLALAAQVVVAAIEAAPLPERVTPEISPRPFPAHTKARFEMSRAAYELFWLRENWPDSPRVAELEALWPYIDEVYSARDFEDAPGQSPADFDFPDEMEAHF